MAHLLVKPNGNSGRVHHVTTESAGWSYVGFDLHRLEPNETAGAQTSGREVCLVLIEGKARISAGGDDFGVLGERLTPFEGKPWSVYVPAGSDWRIAATTRCVLAVCSAPGVAGARTPRVIGPEDTDSLTRGKGTNVRHVTNILPETEPADSLLVVEVITPAAHSSSYPPHKHDRDDLPHESQLEETYYHRMNPPQGFGFQRVYTDDRSLDETMTIEDGDVVMVPRGYHPVAATHGYEIYYLNVMAGPKRIWAFHNDPRHEWLIEG
jgi:5-deoxy-glucuronate isomerase